jgi:hypothetical protein
MQIRGYGGTPDTERLIQRFLGAGKILTNNRSVPVGTPGARGVGGEAHGERGSSAPSGAPAIPELQAPRPKPRGSPLPRVQVSHEIRQWTGDNRAARAPCCPLPGGQSGGEGSERRIRGLWSVDANSLRRARAEDGSPEGAADRSRKWPGRLRRVAARACGMRMRAAPRAVGRGGVRL